MMQSSFEQVIRKQTINNVLYKQLNIGKFYNLPKFTITGNFLPLLHVSMLRKKGIS
jgi:hypothetical protein